MTNKNRNIITVAVLAITTSTIMGILVSTYMQEAASAQYQNSTIGTMLGIMRTMTKTLQVRYG